jgi:hypothetical protein
MQSYSGHAVVSCADKLPQGEKVERNRSLEQMTLEEAAHVLGNGGATGSSAQDERSARVRRSMEQMGLTLSTSHIRRAPGSKALKDTQKEVLTIDLESPSPPPDRKACGSGSTPQVAEDAEDVALAACVARSLNVSGDVQISDADAVPGKSDTSNPSASEANSATAHATSGDASKEAPPRPPGANWQQYFDSDDNCMWYYWPGPGGEWWCGPKEGDMPHPYKGTGTPGTSDSAQ